MTNNNDYRLDEMENAAVDKSQNLKRAGIIGAAAVGVGGVAYGATVAAGSGDETSALNAEDLIAGADAATEDLQAVVEPKPEVPHHHHHVPVGNVPDVNDMDQNMHFDETAVVFDKRGDVVGVYDRGHMGGRDFAFVDEDLNGKADYMTFDANGNGVYEDSEFYRMDNRSVDVGVADRTNYYTLDDGERLTPVDIDPGVQIAGNDINVGGPVVGNMPGNIGGIGNIPGATVETVNGVPGIGDGIGDGIGNVGGVTENAGGPQIVDVGNPIDLTNTASLGELVADNPGEEVTFEESVEFEDEPADFLADNGGDFTTDTFGGDDMNFEIG